MKEFLEKIKVLDATTLKIIAIISMTIDHAGYIFFDNNFIMRSIGRIAMPVFSFFISEGYTKTRNKKKYLAPEMKVVEIEQADIIATSSRNGNFGEPGDIERGTW